MKEREKDAYAKMAAHAHRDAEPSDKKAAARFGRDRSTVSRWRNHGRGSPVYKAIQYLSSSSDPHRVLATMQNAVEIRALDGLTDAELIAKFWRVRSLETVYEQEDRERDARPPSEWNFEEHQNATLRDVAINAEKAALEGLFVLRRINPTDVLGISSPAWTSR